MHVGPTKSDDLPGLGLILDATELFPSEMLPEMLNAFLSNENSDEIWLTCKAEHEPVGFCYAVPEQLTDGAWNMLAIAVHPCRQREGIGRALVENLEAMLKERGQRILIADTSSTDGFERTREFYRKGGYSEQARIPDFWAAGDDKVIFWKAMQ